MNLPIKWLKTLVDIDAPIKEFCDRMTMSGSKVEGYTDLGAEISNVKAGRIISVEKHPNADKLVVCEVSIGDKNIQIVTAAKNVAAGDLVPVALHKSSLAGKIQIERGKLRGVLSEGMFCSIKELGLTLNDCPYAIEDGILILEEGTPGQDIKELLGLDDITVEFEITPNRPDCQSIIALAHEAAVTFGLPFNKPVPPYISGDTNDDIHNYITVDVSEPDLCPRYAARAVKNVRIAPSPAWLRQRLRAAGVRPINNIVDITNYVMLEYGQPMHAFDYKCITGGHIKVRLADENEKAVTLDGKEHILSSRNLVIADEYKPIAVSGVMGGENSEIEADTETVIFESANFFGPSVRITARDIGNRTESSAKFEKGLDPENVLPALNRACELVALLNAGDIVGGMIDVYSVKPPEKTVKFEPEHINDFLGTQISPNEMLRTLDSLDIKYDGEYLHIPSSRADISVMADIAEEVVRFYGYNNIPTASIFGTTTMGKLTENQELREKINILLRGMGLSEALTYTFVSPKVYDRINLPADSTDRKALPIANPLGEETSIMRTRSLPSLLDSLARNYARRNPSASLYEIAKIYIPALKNGMPDITSLAEEKYEIVSACYSSGDFFMIKGILETLFSKLNIPEVVYTANRLNPVYHPGKCAELTCSGKRLGFVGELHPSVLGNYGFDVPVVAFEIDYSVLLSLILPEAVYTPLPRFPATSRDIAVICDEALPAYELEKTVKQAVGDILESIKVFDVYKGKQVPEGKKSVALSFTMRHSDKTLTDEEADSAFTRALKALSEQYGAVLR